MKKTGKFFLIALILVLGLCSPNFVASACGMEKTPEAATGYSSENIDVGHNGNSKEAEKVRYSEHGTGISDDPKNEYTEDVEREDDRSVSLSAITINDTSVDLFTIESWAEEYISIPDNLKQSFQIKVTGAKSVSYTIISGSSVTVSDKGLIEPVYETWYWYGNIGYSYPLEGQTPTRVEKSPVCGVSKIKVTADSKTFTVTANVLEYAEYYADKKIDEYIKENITGKNLTAVEKITFAAKMAASYNYSVYASGYISMIVSGGGDCWASTSLIIKFCEKLGYDAWARNGNRDPGAGSGHMNALAQLPNGDIYELEAGYTGTAPRMYTVVKRESLFSYYNVNGGVEVYQYDGKDDTGVLTVPASIGGEPVVGLGKSFVSMADFTEVKLPDSLKYIGESAFNTCMKLKKLNIPANVSEIGTFAFTQCTALTTFTCSAKNANFTIESGVLYDKNRTTVIACPTAEKVVLPDTVKTIEEYSFYYNKKLKSIVIPSSVTSMGEGAFGDCAALKTITIKGSALKTVGDYCFDNTAIESIVIPASVNQLGTYAFAYCDSLKNIYFKGNFPQMGNLKLKENYPEEYENVFKGITATAYYNPDASGWTSGARKQYGGTVKWKTWNGRFVSVEECDIKLNKTSWQYTGKAVVPEVTVTYKGKTLKKGQDYTIQYKNNKNIGKGAVYVSGTGLYNGSIKKSFKISVKKGKTYTVNGYKYKITNANTTGSGTVSVTGNTNAKKTMLVIKDTVTIGGVSFKVTAVSTNAFKGFKKLKSVEIGKNVKTIGRAAFYGCTSLKKVKIKSAKLTTIGKKAFAGCRKLSSFVIKSAKLKKSSVGESAFKGIYAKCTFKVPASKKSSYKSIFIARGAGRKIKVTKL